MIAATRRAATSPSSAAQPADAGQRPQPDRPEAAAASSPSCRRSSRPARCRPTWWCNEPATHDCADGSTARASAALARWLPASCSRARAAAASRSRDGSRCVATAEPAMPRAASRSGPPAQSQPPTSPAVEAFMRHARGQRQQPQPRRRLRHAAPRARAKPPMPPPRRPTAAQQYCANIADAGGRRALRLAEAGACRHRAGSSTSASRCSRPRRAECRSG